MTNMKKLGLSALAGSLVAFSANAAELSVSGGVELTYVDTGGNNGNEVTGIMFGQTPGGGAAIRLDQGLDTTAISFQQVLSDTNPDMIESAYTIQIDNRLGSIATTNGESVSLDYIDDDDIAFYNVTSEDGIVRENPDRVNATTGQVIAGPRGTILEFKIRASLELNTSTFLFTEIGSTSRLDARDGSSSEVYHIDSNVRITGVSTGYSVDVPVRFVKFKAT